MKIDLHKRLSCATIPLMNHSSIKKFLRDLKNDPDLEPDGEVGQLPNEFIKGRSREDIIELNAKIKDIFYEFSKGMQQLDEWFYTRSAEGERIPLTMHVPEETIVNSEPFQECQRAVRALGIPIKLSLIGCGQMGKVFKLDLDGEKQKHVLKVFKNPEYIYKKEIISQHNDVDLKNALLANEYDRGRYSPKVHMGRFGRDGFMLSNFIDREKSHKNEKRYSKSTKYIKSDDDHGENKLGDTLVDFGGTRHNAGLDSKLHMKIARQVARALDNKSVNHAKFLAEKYKDCPEFSQVVDKMVYEGAWHIAEEVIYNSTDKDKFPEDVFDVLGKRNDLLKEVIGKRLIDHNYLTGQILELYTPNEVAQEWCESILRQHEKRKGESNSNYLKHCIHNFLQKGVTPDKFTDMGIQQDAVTSASKLLTFMERLKLNMPIISQTTEVAKYVGEHAVRMYNSITETMSNVFKPNRDNDLDMER